MPTDISEQGAAMTEDGLPTERLTYQPPSCIESCPADPSIFVIGTYQLKEGPKEGRRAEISGQSRTGRIELYQVRQKGSSSGFGLSTFIDEYDFPDCAILDLHFWPQDPAIFAVCTSTSRMVFFRLEHLTGRGGENLTKPSIYMVGSLVLGDDSTVLATSFAWDPQPTVESSGYMSFAVTFSSGETRLFEIISEQSSRGLHGLHICSQKVTKLAHSLEAWTVTFVDPSCSPEMGKLLLTGGDDSVLAVHSFKHEADSGVTISRDRRSHLAGVTAILTILDVSRATQRESVIVTGSYDEYIRVFTLGENQPYQLKLVAELLLGGGVWRLAKMSENIAQEVDGQSAFSALVLVSCMHAGVRVVRITQRQPEQKSGEPCRWEMEVVGQFTEGHQSMCYGSAFVSVRNLITEDRAPPDERLMLRRERCNGPFECDDFIQNFIVVSTSFYDRKVCVWSFHLQATISIAENDPNAKREVRSEKSSRQKTTGEEA